MVRKACFFLLFFTGVFSYAVGNRSLVVKTPRALSSHDYPQEGIVSFLLEEGIYVRLAVMPGWHVIRGNISNASRLSLETTMEFEGPIRSPDVRLAFVLRNEKNKPIYTTNILSDTKIWPC
ncbi:MAG: hypothetical protein N2314_02225 [Brevinematales bacterium]|nr:hypothetical protein [Brevinematales bacterium]